MLVSNQLFFSLYLSLLGQVFNHRSPLAKAERVAADINAAGGKAIAIPGDVLDPAFPDRLIQGTVK